MLGVLHCGGAVVTPAWLSNMVDVHLRVQEAARHGTPLQRFVRRWASFVATGQLPRLLSFVQGGLLASPPSALATPPSAHWWPRGHEGCTTRDPLAAGNTNVGLHGPASEGCCVFTSVVPARAPLFVVQRFLGTHDDACSCSISRIIKR
ncbi:LAG1 longevity assurance homolog 2 [Zea mays]|jgi:hypothetical protein|uniref:LAG1 longevity assurance homolog 2 n=1 Tax=Zea mays TaxID=4577 RepID=A0A1D6JX44_MAIZE|nr:LAG1 longevity assurance homolog 2 [Zea mays]ONL96284.1 LAG1 longevity assurance homolog 2 [Zea mays]